MKKSIILFVLFSISISLHAQKTYLQCGNLIDTESGKLLSEMTIVVEGNKIIEVNKGYIFSNNSEDKLVDLKSKTVMPGLIDMHVHLEMQMSPSIYIESFTANEADVAFNSIKYAEITLMAGFTTVRDLGGSGVNVSLRNAINSGGIIGPRIFSTEK